MSASITSGIYNTVFVFLFYSNGCNSMAIEMYIYPVSFFLHNNIKTLFVFPKNPIELKNFFYFLVFSCTICSGQFGKSICISNPFVVSRCDIIFNVSKIYFVFVFDLTLISNFGKHNLTSMQFFRFCLFFYVFLVMK